MKRSTKMINIEQTNKYLENMIDEHNELLDKYKLTGGFGNWYIGVKTALTELERLQKFKSTFDAYELSQKQGFIAYENWQECERELELLQKKYKLADDTLAIIGETLVDESKSHITGPKAIREIRRYTSAYHNKDWSDEK